MVSDSLAWLEVQEWSQTYLGVVGLVSHGFRSFLHMTRGFLRGHVFGDFGKHTRRWLMGRHGGDELRLWSGVEWRMIREEGENEVGG